MIRYKLPFDESTKTLVRRLSADGLKPRTISRVMQLAELTDQSAEDIVARYKKLDAEVKSTLYGT